MARFEYTSTIAHYSFSIPEFVSEENYNLLKMKVIMNPSAPLIEETSAESKHEKLTLLIVIGIIALGIGLLGIFSTENPPGWSIILILISVFGILHPLLNMGTYQSSQNYINAEREKIEYFQKLKRIIMSSSDYRGFLDNYRKTFLK